MDIIQQLGGFGGQLSVRYKDMGDGTHALVVVAEAGPGLGVFALKTILKDVDYQIEIGDSLIRMDATDGPRTATLPPAAEAYSSVTKMGSIFGVKKVGTGENLVTVDGALIDGAPTFQMANSNDCAAFQSNGISYDVLFRSQ
jgi:hypothetical protein